MGWRAPVKHGTAIAAIQSKANALPTISSSLLGYVVFAYANTLQITPPLSLSALIMAIGLTTIFTPPASCSLIITYDGQFFWQGGVLQTGDPDCYPASFYSVVDSFYSPGICPHGWTSASAVAGTGALVFGTTETNAICCPT